MRLSAFLLLVGVFLLQACKLDTSHPDHIRLNHIQVIGSHNSYKKAIQGQLMDLISREDSSLALALDYEHAPLLDQLRIGLRQLELDVFHDPEGGRYSHPLGNTILDSLGIQPLLYNQHNQLDARGFKVLHIQDIDFRSHCLVFQKCLDDILQWSQKNPNHLPILITINPKDNGVSRAGFHFTQPLPIREKALDSLDNEILEVLGRKRLITPDDVRGDYQTLEEAVLAGQWPQLKNCRGKFLFGLDAGVDGDIIKTYKKDHPSLRDRVMFVNSIPGTPEAAFMVMNDPLKMQEDIQKRVKAGYLVRTRADAGTLEARIGDRSRFEAAKSSGAQFISTDYYIPDPRFSSSYQVMPPDGIAWCNPLFEIGSCDGFDFE